MGETTKEDATKPSPNQISSPKDSSLDHQTPTPSLLHHHHHHQSFLPSSIFIPTASSPGAKRPRGGLSPPQWIALPSSSTVPTAARVPSSPTPSTAIAASSTETAGSSPPGQEPNSEKQTESLQHKFRKGKYVSPVWKPNEMLWLARAWRVEYQQQQATGSGSGSGPGEGRGKTRAEKDRDVAEFLNRHGVNRDSKTAGTKWDNMLGEFRKVHEWENGGDRETYGKSYFRLSPYERKQHRLPASFDEDVYKELALFMGPRIRAPSIRSGGAPAATAVEPLPPPPPQVVTSRDDFVHTSTNPIGRGKRLALTVVGDDNPQYPYSHNIARGSGLFSLYNPCSQTIPSSSSSASSLKDLRRVGKIRLTWEESVNLWAEEGDVDYGRIRVSGSSFLNADELTYLDDSTVACSMESFEDGPLKGFSLDKFMSGQHLKVFGRQKSTPPSTSAISTLEVQDPSEHYLSKLRVPAGNLPNLFELARYIQEPPPENLRFPLRRDVYKDLPPGKELFFSTSSRELLDSRAITYDIIGPIMARLNHNIISSKDSLIPLWEGCVNRVVSKFCEMVVLRKPDSSSSSRVENVQDQWPNVMGFVKGYGLWRGEETDKIREGESDPSSLLSQKILWSFNDLPYVLGYHATGFTVTFTALSKSSQDSRVICTDLYSFDVSSPSDRIKALVPCYRLASLLPLLADRCATTTRHLCYYNDFERFDNGDSVTEVTPHTVTKYYSSKRDWSRVKGIYEFLDQRVPHTEHLDRSSEKDLSLSFKPRGVRAMPRDVDQLIESLMCVTRALVALHDLSFMHRDMGWHNVVRSVSTDVEWFVCGFDAAGEAPQLNPYCPAGKAVEKERGRHAPEMERGLHAVKVDVWGVGYMIKTCGLSNVPKMLRELQGKCLETNQENRPTAADCYHHLLQVQSAGTSTY